MNKFTYKEHFTQRYADCVLSDSMDAFSEAVREFGMKDRRVLLIAEKKYAGFYLKQLSEQLEGSCRALEVFELTEDAPDFHLTAARVDEAALKMGLEKNDCIISLGGMISDAAAKVYIAEYFPEMLYIKIPVTFIGQLLSTAEGDAALDLDTEKGPGLVLMPNAAMAGDVRTMLRKVSPVLVYINIFAYKNLEETERISGLGEAIRCAAAADSGLFQYMEGTSGKKADGFSEFLLNVIFNCLRINRQHPENAFPGKAVAKGLERCTNHIIPHGQAVGIGLAVAYTISANRNLLKSEDTLRLAKCMVSYGLSVMMNFTNDLIDAICAAISENGDADENGTLKSFDLIEKIGRCRTANDVTLEEIRTAMHYRR